MFASMTYLLTPSIGLFTLAAALIPLALVFDFAGRPGGTLAPRALDAGA